jgi:FKBP-type peptidyl-prolyl cis-trans isomerase FkpA
MHRCPAWCSIGWLSCLLLVVAAAACGSNPNSPDPPTAPYSQTDLVAGTGAEASAGSRATVTYTGWLYDPAKTDGKGAQFDTAPSYSFVVGTGAVIAGWDKGVPGMRIGGQRRLVIPASLAYGSSGRGVIPPNATLVFDIGLLNVQ